MYTGTLSQLVRFAPAIASIMLGVVVAGATAWVAWPDDPGSINVQFLVRRPLPDQAATLVEGDACSFDTTNANLLIVMRPNGALLGTVQPTTGTLVRAALPTLGVGWICQTEASLRVPRESTQFYLVQVNRQPAELMYDFELGNRSVWWFDEPAYVSGPEGQ